MARIITMEELIDKPAHGYCVMEYRPEPEDNPEIPWSEYVHECAWIDNYTMLVDCYGGVSFGNWTGNQVSEYEVSWRVWNERPTYQEHLTPWKEE